ncbi:MAG: xanthine dehydrogenase family protein molybdopterin-binding subunit, partial [Stellaceae bacterium]
MDARENPHDWSLQQFGIGQPVPRSEDPKLLRGEGRYTDDINLPDQAHAVIVRSRVAHGILRAVDAAEARAMPGVLGVYTAADLKDYGTFRCVTTFPNRDGTPMKLPVWTALAPDKVRYVGDAIACVVAETPAQAKDAAEAVMVDIDALPAVTRAKDAAASGAPQLYDDIANNVCLDFHFGDAEKVKEAFARAAHVTRVELVNNRLVVCAMEPRSAIASFDAGIGKWTLNVGCQGTFGLRNQIANDILKVPTDKVRVLTGNVGGSFGMKAMAYPEYTCLFHAARALGRPVKWTDERSESFLSDTHGRDHEVVAELALDAEGHFLA